MYERGALYHIVPEQDLRDHQVSESCWCKPEPDVKDDNVIIHNALDAREGYEDGTRKPS